MRMDRLKINTRVLKTLVGMVVIAILGVACSTHSGDSYSEAEITRPSANYLGGTVLPCTPVEGLVADPCREGELDSVDLTSEDPESSGSFDGTDAFPVTTYGKAEPDTVSELLYERLPFGSAHLVVRGVVLPKSARCELYNFVVNNFDDPVTYAIVEHSIGDLNLYQCLQEVLVREYIVGRGPAVLSVIMDRQTVYLQENETWESIKSDWLAAQREDPIKRVERLHGGREMVLFLKPARSLRVEAWTSIGRFFHWYVQERDGEVRAIVEGIEGFDKSDTETYSMVDRLLSEFVAEIKQTASVRAGLSEARVGANMNSPQLVMDGNKLQEYYVAAGAVYEGEGKTTVLPPSPSADFVPPSTTTSTTVPVSTSSTVEASTSTTATSSTTVAPSSTTTVPVPSTSTTSVPTSTTTIPEPSTTTTTIPEPTTTTVPVPVTSTTTVSATTSTTVAQTTTTVATTTTPTSTVPSTTSTTAAGGVSISVSDASATEGEWLLFNVTLSEEPYRQVVVNYSVRDVTAESGVDYQSPAGTFLFGPFDVRKTVRVWIVDDSKTEETETFQLVLSDPYGASITKPVGTGTILDND